MLDRQAKAWILDCEMLFREEFELFTGEIPRAQNIAVSSLGQAVHHFESDKPILFICAKGGRAAWATRTFCKLGFDAKNVTGGMEAWKEAGLALV